MGRIFTHKYEKISINHLLCHSESNRGMHATGIIARLQHKETFKEAAGPATLMHISILSLFQSRGGDARPSDVERWQSVVSWSSAPRLSVDA